MAAEEGCWWGMGQWRGESDMPPSNPQRLEREREKTNEQETNRSCAWLLRVGIWGDAERLPSLFVKKMTHLLKVFIYAK